MKREFMEVTVYYALALFHLETDVYGKVCYLFSRHTIVINLPTAESLDKVGIVSCGSPTRYQQYSDDERLLDLVQV